MCVCVYMCVYIYTYIYVYVRVCAFIVALSLFSVVRVRKNARGGVYVDPNEVKQAFEFFDVDSMHAPTVFVYIYICVCVRAILDVLFHVTGRGVINMKDLERRLKVFYPNLSTREYKFLMNNKVWHHPWC